MVALHESLGKILATFQFCPFFRWTYDHGVFGSIVIFQCIVDAIHKWIFGSNDNHVNLLVANKIFDGIEIVHLNVDIGAYFTCSSVAGSDEQLGYSFALCYFPAQGVFSSATT